MCAQASCVKEHLCTIPKIQFIYYYSLGHSRFGRCLATLKQLKARATGSLTEDMSLGKMLTVYMTLNWQNPDPNFILFFSSYCAQLLQSIPLEKVSSRQFFLNGQDFSGERLCWAYCGSHFLAHSLSQSPFWSIQMKKFKIIQVLVGGNLSHSIVGLMTAPQELRGGKPELKFSHNRQEVPVKLQPFNMYICQPLKFSIWSVVLLVGGGVFDWRVAGLRWQSNFANRHEGGGRPATNLHLSDSVSS